MTWIRLTPGYTNSVSSLVTSEEQLAMLHNQPNRVAKDHLTLLLDYIRIVLAIILCSEKRCPNNQRSLVDGFQARCACLGPIPGASLCAYVRIYYLSIYLLFARYAATMVNKLSKLK